MNIERQELQRRIASQRITRPGQKLPNYSDTFTRELQASRYLKRVAQLCLVIALCAFGLMSYWTVQQLKPAYDMSAHAITTVNHVL